jgi:hypothetical protein
LQVLNSYKPQIKKTLTKWPAFFFELVGARGFAHYVTGILPVPASAPLLSLSRPSLAAFRPLDALAPLRILSRKYE